MDKTQILSKRLENIKQKLARLDIKPDIKIPSYTNENEKETTDEQSFNVGENLDKPLEDEESEKMDKVT